MTVDGARHRRADRHRRVRRAATRKAWWRLPAAVLTAVALVFGFSVVWASDGDDVTYRVEGTLLLTRADLGAALDSDATGAVRFGAPELAAILADGRTDRPDRRVEVVDAERLRLVVTPTDGRTVGEELDLALEQAAESVPWGHDLLVTERTAADGEDVLGGGALLRLVPSMVGLGELGRGDEELIGRTVREHLRGAEGRQAVFADMEPGELSLTQQRWEAAPVWRLDVTAAEPEEAELAFDRSVERLQEVVPEVQAQLGVPASVRAEVTELSRTSRPIAVVDELLSVFFLGMLLVFGLLALVMVAVVRAVAPADHAPWRGDTSDVRSPAPREEVRT